MTPDDVKAATDLLAKRDTWKRALATSFGENPTVRVTVLSNFNRGQSDIADIAFPLADAQVFIQSQIDRVNEELAQLGITDAEIAARLLFIKNNTPGTISPVVNPATPVV